MEAKAIRALFGQHTDNILVHSTKSMIGHGLGAAGVLELIALLLAFERGVIHPTINLERQDEECPINVVAESPSTERSVVLSQITLALEDITRYWPYSVMRARAKETEPISLRLGKLGEA